MMRLRSDLAAACLAAVDDRLADARIEWDNRAALGVVLAAGGYPGSYGKGAPISGLDSVAGLADVKGFHAGTALDEEGRVVTAGGRVLCAVALGDSVTEAQRRAYEATRSISWDGVYYRTDIGYRAVAREA